VRRTQPRAASRAALATAAAGAIVTLVGCGSQVPGGQRASVGPAASGSQSGSADVRGTVDRLGGAFPPAAMCADISHLTSVVVSHESRFRTFLRTPILPRGVTIVDQGTVHGIATALCRLPAWPSAPGTVTSCPADFGGSLRFAFAAGGLAFPPVNVRTSGCRVVTGLGPPRTATSAAFWQTLDTDLGGLSSLPSPNASGGIGP